ncbi:MAG: LysE family translocator [Bacteroidetes bacterium]|nr:MAG: LysE family translocator [Bacteroidota bacterium]
MLDGILFGLPLTILMGPLLFAIVQTSIEQGFRAGLAVGAGIWVSDLLFVLCAFFGVSYILAVVQWEGFELAVGSAGTIILLIIGFGMLLSQKQEPAPSETNQTRYKSYFSLWLKGYLINTVNPFTFIFWLVITPAQSSKYLAASHGVGKFYIGILAIIFLTDFAKIALAKKIQPWLKPRNVLLMRRIAGAALIVFGIILLIRCCLLFCGKIDGNTF